MYLLHVFPCCILLYVTFFPCSDAADFVEFGDIQSDLKYHKWGNVHKDGADKVQFDFISIGSVYDIPVPIGLST